MQNYVKIAEFNIFVRQNQINMAKELNILLTNDDGYDSQGIMTLAGIMRQFGRLTVVAPKFHQSGMSMAVSMGCKAVAVKKVQEIDGERWYYVDATPSSCVKYGIDNVLFPSKPDVVICGINHGSNAATAANYSGTLGAAEEGAINGVLGIGVSLDVFSAKADFSAVEKFFPDIFLKIMALPRKYGVFYNINFPNIPAEKIKGVRVAHQGYGHWEREFKEWDTEYFTRRGIVPEALGQTSNPKAEEGETLYMMVGDFVDDSPKNDALADHHLVAKGYISIVAHNLDNTDWEAITRMREAGLDADFK